MSSVEKPNKVSLEVYLEIEDANFEKSEFYNGEIFSMAGGSYEHSLISGNIYRALGNSLLGKDCRLLTSELKIQIEAANAIVYPDAMVICGQPEFAWPRRDIVRNPTLVVEVLSPGNEGYDRGGKFRKYKLLKSLREYVLVEQDSANVDVFYLNEDGQWVNELYSGLEAEVELRSLGVRIALGDVYRDVEIA
jgi:Uma2 family endonuclease